MFHKSREHTNATLLKQLLINHTKCPDKNLWPRNEKEWGSFIDMSYRNRLVTILYHFVICKDCSRDTPEEVKNLIQRHYLDTIIRYKNYQKIKNKIKQFIKNTGIQLILIKDLEKKYMRYYPPFYVPLKFDIDILGEYKHFLTFQEFIKKYEFTAIKHPQTEQFKFSTNKKNSYFPQIEFRYQAINNTAQKKLILIESLSQKLSIGIWNNLQIQNRGFTKLLEEYLIIQLCLIYYFEDNCIGLNNLFRIWSLAKQTENKLNWQKVDEIAERYSVTNIVSFVLSLAEREFSQNRLDFSHRSISLKLSLRLIDLNYISRAKISVYKNYANWKDGYIHFLTRGLLAKDPLWRKVIFFAHPKRLLFLVWELITP